MSAVGTNRDQPGRSCDVRWSGQIGSDRRASNRRVGPRLVHLAPARNRLRKFHLESCYPAATMLASWRWRGALDRKLQFVAGNIRHQRVTYFADQCPTTFIRDFGHMTWENNLLYFPGSPTLVDFGGISFTASVPVSLSTPLGTDAFGIGFTGSVYGITQQSSNPSGECCGVNPITFEVAAAAVPGPIVGAGLPGLVMALGGLIALRRRRMIAA